ncbi:N-acetylglucosamine kinase [Egibacter rhizosphaerae]|nr:BadF/BadG/BcrA/BcrD ATPase family protein [Egibacter rhizosphaerae]
MRPLVLIVDGGATGTRARWLEGDQRAEGTGVPHVSAAGEQAVAEAVASAVEGLPDVPVPDGTTLVAGLTGLFETPEAAGGLGDALRARIGVETVVLTGDVVTAHAGALGGASGVVVAAGTGSVALAVGDDGTWARADGWGALLGDAGSGHWIGRRALEAALRWYDGRAGGSQALAASAQERYGPLGGVASRVYAASAPVREIAAFARDAAEVARAGDEVARSIWSSAAEELAETATAAARRAGSTEGIGRVSWTGGLLDVADLLGAPFREAVSARLPGARIVAPLGDPLDGAGVIARGSAVHEPLVLTGDG